MIEIEIEVRDSNKISNYAYYERVTRDEAMREMVDAAMGPFLEMKPELSREKYFITPSKSWAKLPKYLYLVYETNDSPGYSVHRLTKKKTLVPTAETYSFIITFSLAASLDQEPLLIRYLCD